MHVVLITCQHRDELRGVNTADNLDVVGVQRVIRYRELQQVESVELLEVGEAASVGSGNTMHTRGLFPATKLLTLRSSGSSKPT